MSIEQVQSGTIRNNTTPNEPTSLTQPKPIHPASAGNILCLREPTADHTASTPRANLAHTTQEVYDRLIGVKEAGQPLAIKNRHRVRHAGGRPRKKITITGEVVPPGSLTRLSQIEGANIDFPKESVFIGRQVVHTFGTWLL